MRLRHLSVFPCGLSRLWTFRAVSGTSFWAIWPMYSEPLSRSNDRSIDKPNRSVVAFRPVHHRLPYSSACSFVPIYSSSRTRTHKDVLLYSSSTNAVFGGSYVFCFISLPFGVYTTVRLCDRNRPTGVISRPGDPTPSHDPWYPIPPRVRSTRFRYVRPGVGFQTDYRPYTGTRTRASFPIRYVRGAHLGFRAFRPVVEVVTVDGIASGKTVMTVVRLNGEVVTRTNAPTRYLRAYGNERFSFRGLARRPTCPRSAKTKPIREKQCARPVALADVSVGRSVRNRSTAKNRPGSDSERPEFQCSSVVTPWRPVWCGEKKGTGRFPSSGAKKRPRRV